MRHVDRLLTKLLEQRAHSITLFGELHGKDVITRVTHRLSRGRLPPPGCPLDAVVTTGRPNYRERKFLKRRRKAGQYRRGMLMIQMPPQRRSA